ncbi:Imm50 family immunity protein [Methylococcus sp. EFPC2]|uniref:Imm50 family immunity protein n=1 Tax=Methylococcus sp. EFPC2 TaxID=2812648 RepID=UPI0019676B28|nr:Imm50 family immunity protein [Methylococcus sp. EFPC2]QSA96125.1 hypothetical protein JWZ97_12885 [Methylococcus sp. EFPC2]
MISKLGYWPEFCDAKFLELGFSRYSDLGTSLSMLLHYIDTDKGFDLNVRIVLVGIIQMEFHGLAIENVIDRIGLIDSGKGGVEFELEAAAGLYGGCSCEIANVELVSIKTFSAGL